MCRHNRAVLLNQTAEYALRLAASMAGIETGCSITAARLSERTGIPLQYLSKVMRRLVVAKLVTSRRGQGGGFVLARPPAEISLMQVLAATDFRVDPDRCAFGMSCCDSQHPCPLHPVWSPLKDALQEWADGHTLADFGPAPRLLRWARSADG